MSKSSPCSVSDSILKLRSLRDKLCSSEKEWKEAFKVRDFLVEELICLSSMLEDESKTKEDCHEKISEILKDFSSESKNKGS
jgi:predicted Holliday junction resolvase-like endonuclease